MFSNKKNPILKHLINTIITNAKTNNNTSDIKVQTLTGPMFINEFFQPFIIAKDKNKISYIEVFPHYMFEPTQPFGHSDIRDSTLAIHKFEMSWISPQLKFWYNLYFQLKPFLPILIAVFLLKLRS